MVLMFLCFVVLFVVIIVFIYSVLSVKMEYSENLMSVYECGFDNCFGFRKSFSYRFFLIAILFLVFDVEIVLLLSFPFLLLGKFSSFAFCVFVLVLLVGLLYEMSWGVLSWVE